MIISNTDYKNTLVLSPHQSNFKHCTFKRITANENLIYANDASIYCSFFSCLFYWINLGLTKNYVILVDDAAEEIQDRCCYSEETSYCIYGSTTNLKSESINSTICTNSNSYAPFCRCLTELTSFFNNHSFLYRTGDVSCYYLYVTPNKEDINCFFSGSSCSGDYPVAHESNKANCVLTKFNLVNNTDSSGYFWIGYGNHKRVKESVIVFKSTTSLNWLFYCYSGATLSIEGCTVIASGTIDGMGEVSIIEGIITTNITPPTHAPFYSHPQYSQCNRLSMYFSGSTAFSLKSLSVFLVFTPILVV